MTRQLILGLTLVVAAAGCASANKPHDAQVAQAVPAQATAYPPAAYDYSWVTREPAAAFKAGEFNVGDVLSTTQELTWTTSAPLEFESASAKCGIATAVHVKKGEEIHARAGNDYRVVRKHEGGKIDFANDKDPKKVVFSMRCFSKTPKAPKRHEKAPRIDVEAYPYNPNRMGSMKKGHGPVYPVENEKSVIMEVLKARFSLKSEVQPPPVKRIEIDYQGEPAQPATGYDI